MAKAKRGQQRVATELWPTARLAREMERAEATQVPRPSRARTSPFGDLNIDMHLNCRRQPSRAGSRKRWTCKLSAANKKTGGNRVLTGNGGSALDALDDVLDQMRDLAKGKR